MATTETGASVLRYPEKQAGYTRRQYKVFDADVRLGLALMAEHVYCVDGHKRYFELPGFRMAGLEVYQRFVGVDAKDGKNVETNVHTQTGWFQGDARNYLETKAQNNTKDIKYTFEFDDGRYHVLDNEHTINGFKATDEMIYYSQLNKGALVSGNGENRVSLQSESDEYGMLNPCGFKAAIYERTSDEYDYSIFAGEAGGRDLSRVRYVLCFSGTDDVSIKEDWIRGNANQALFGGATYSLQYKLAELTAIKIAGSTGFNKSEWLIVGHSLGGGLASAASVASGIPAITFNAAGLNVYSIADYIKRLSGQSLSYAVSDTIPTNLAPVAFLLDTLSFLNVAQNSALCDKVKEKSGNVIAYRSTTDVLTSTQDDVTGSKNNYGEKLPRMIATMGERNPLLYSVAPIGISIGNLVALFLKHGLPNTFGDRRDVLTGYGETYKSSSCGDYLKIDNEGIGHGMQMMVDGFVNMIYKINNHLVTLQSGGLDNWEMYNKIIRHYFYVPSKDADSDGNDNHIKLVYVQYADGDQSISADKARLSYPVYGFVDDGTMGAVVRNSDTVGTGNAVWRKEESTSGNPNNAIYEQPNRASQEPSHHSQEKKPEKQREKLTKKIVTKTIGRYQPSTQEKIKELFGIEE